MQEFFKNEFKDTLNKLNSLYEDGCLCFNIITDSHVYPPYEEWLSRQWHTFENVEAINKAAKVDAIFHLGDMFWTNGSKETIDFWNTENLEKWMDVFKERLCAANPYTYFIAGNHDNEKCGEPNQESWHRRMVEFQKDKITGFVPDRPYYYVDFESAKVRAVCMLSNFREGEHNQHKNYGIYPEQVEWLISDALKVPDGWSILLFSHIYPVNEGNDSAQQDNTEEFAGLIRAFQNKEKFQSDIWSADFSDYGNAKIVAMFVGHGHVDWLHGPDELPFYVVETAANHVHVPERSSWRMPEDAVVPPREYGTFTEDLWDTVVYNPQKGRIDIIRFGAGEDRHIEL